MAIEKINLTYNELKELIELEHKFKLEEIRERKNAELEVEKFKFEKQLELQRIRSAEIKKTIEKKKELNLWRENERFA